MKTEYSLEKNGTQPDSFVSLENKQHSWPERSRHLHMLLLLPQNFSCPIVSPASVTLDVEVFDVLFFELIFCSKTFSDCASLHVGFFRRTVSSGGGLDLRCPVLNLMTWETGKWKLTPPHAENTTTAYRPWSLSAGLHRSQFHDVLYVGALPANISP